MVIFFANPGMRGISSPRDRFPRSKKHAGALFQQFQGRGAGGPGGGRSGARRRLFETISLHMDPHKGVEIHGLPRVQIHGRTDGRLRLTPPPRRGPTSAGTQAPLSCNCRNRAPACFLERGNRSRGAEMPPEPGYAKKDHFP